MADCFSLPNAAELVEQLRSNPNNAWMMQAADAIEALAQETKDLLERNHTLAATNFKLLDENAKLKAERDAAILDIEIRCGTCKNQGIYCLTCHTGYERWEWRGVKEDKDATD